MFCENCGQKINDGEKCCPSCGWQVPEGEILEPVVGQEPESARAAEPAEPEEPVAEEPAEPETAAEETAAEAEPAAAPAKKPGGKKWIAIGVAAVVVIALIAGLALFGGSSKEYKEKLEQGDQYLAELDYDRAEAAYLEAAKVKPKKPDAYQKLVTVYTGQNDYESAEKILKTAEKAGCTSGLETEKQTVTMYRVYEGYASSTAAGKPVPEKEAVETCHGKLGSVISDVDGDGTANLVIINCDYDDTESGSEEGTQKLWWHKGLILDVLLYGYEEDSVKLLDEAEIACGGYADPGIGGFKFDLFLKKMEQGDELVIVNNGASVNDSFHVAQVVTFDGGKVAEAANVAAIGGQGTNLWVNGEAVFVFNPYDYDPSEMESEYYKAVEEVKKQYVEVTKPYGLDGKLKDENRTDGAWNYVEIKGYDKGDKTETHIARIVMGNPDWASNYMPNGPDRFYFESFTK